MLVTDVSTASAAVIFRVEKEEFFFFSLFVDSEDDCR